MPSVFDKNSFRWNYLIFYWKSHKLAFQLSRFVKLWDSLLSHTVHMCLDTPLAWRHNMHQYSTHNTCRSDTSLYRHRGNLGIDSFIKLSCFNTCVHYAFICINNNLLEWSKIFAFMTENGFSFCFIIQMVVSILFYYCCLLIWVG